MLEHGTGVGLGYEEHQEPGGALPKQVTDGGPKVGLLQRLRSTQALDVFASFLQQDVRGVIGGDDSKQAVVFIDDRKCDQSVLIEQARGFLAIRVYSNPVDVLDHELVNRRVGSTQDQVAQREYAQ